MDLQVWLDIKRDAQAVGTIEARFDEMDEEHADVFFFFKQKTAYELPLRLVGSGSAFGAPGYARLSYAASAERLREGLDRLVDADLL